MNSIITRPSDNKMWQFNIAASGVLFLAVISVALVFFYIHEKDVSNALSKSELFTRFALNDAQINNESDIAALEEKTRHLMEINGYSSITLYDQQDRSVFSHGLPITTKEYNKKHREKDKWRHRNKFFTSIKVSKKSQEKAFRLIIAIDNTDLNYIGFQFIFYFLLIFFGVIFFSFFYQRKLKDDIFTPLNDINETLSRQQKSRTISPVSIPRAGIYDELIQQINASFTTQLDEKKEEYSQIEESQYELKESLESLEERNIELGIAYKKAVEQGILKSKFVNKTCIGLNTLIHDILNHTAVLEKESLTRTLKNHVHAIENSTNNLLTVIGELQDLSQLESGTISTNIKLFKPRKLIDDILTLHSHQAHEHDINLFSSTDINIPTIAAGDAARIQQVLSSLIFVLSQSQHATYIDIQLKAGPEKSDAIDFQFLVATDGKPLKEFTDWHEKNISSTESDSTSYSELNINLSLARGIATHMNGDIRLDTKDNLCALVFEIELQKPKEPLQLMKKIDPRYPVISLVFSNTEPGYRSINSRLNELGIGSRRVDTFKEILTQAKALKEEIKTHIRTMTLAVIEAQTSQQGLDKTLLIETLNILTKEHAIPAVVIAPLDQKERLQTILDGTNIFIVQQPILNAHFRKAILSELGIFKLGTNASPQAKKRQKTPVEVLVVDDNPANLKLASALLADFDINTTQVASGMQALEKFQGNYYDAIFMDIELPDINGYETTKKMREIDNSTRRTPIIALTAHDVAEEKINLLVAGMDDFISKPLRTEDIQRVLNRWVAKASKQKERNIISHTQKKEKDLEKMITTPDVIKTRGNFVDGSVVNIQDCLMLTKNDPLLAKDMLSMLIDSLANERQEMDRAFLTKDYKKLHNIVHRLHGACCYSGVNPLKTACKALDSNLKNGILDNIDQEVHELYKHMDALEEWGENHDIYALFE